MYKQSKKSIKSNGFTLIEILIVMTIIGVLATMVFATLKNTGIDAMKTAFQLNGKKFVEAATRFHLDYGVYPEASALGSLPKGFENYIQAEQWFRATPIGGMWDCQLNAKGATSAIGVDFNGATTVRDDVFMQKIDSAIDDGDLATGGFRKLSNGRFYFIVKD